ncbi:hypothetical protein [Lactobacillus amylolyticus]|uniref:hypothetical protein n=1 Tax=Lactobacillus amylolyticus TaxID=83683 RepID=UPI002490DAAF|nr:hypothetical protein [Lactobacillus amylolyticus]
MAYLASNEYKIMTGQDAPENFDELENDAENIINSVTNYYDPAFGLHDLAADACSPFNYLVQQATAFKKAVASQVKFLNDSNSSSAFDMQQQNLASYSVGGTSMSFKNGAIDNLADSSTGLVNTAHNLLGRAGLLFQGVDHL